jgi:hypothetical protein
MNHRIFVSSGGMGSTHLVHSIRATGTTCVEKPMDNTFYTERWPRVARVERKKPVVAGLHELPSPKICRRFIKVQNKRSNAPEHFSLDPTKTLAVNLLNYFAFLGSNGSACVLRATSLEGLLNDNGVRDVVFLIRDPVQSYLSFAKPERHKNIIDKLGGVEGADAIAFWCWSWNSLAGEYLKAKSNNLDPVLVRYELVEADTAQLESPFLKKVFGTFSPKRNEVLLPERCERRIRELVSENYASIYGTRPIS